MKIIDIPGVPADVHHVLTTRAAAEGMSLQEFLLGKLIAEARRPTIDKVLESASHDQDWLSQAHEDAELLHDEDLSQEKDAWRP